MLGQNIVRIPILIAVITVFWEHLASINNLQYKPSVVIGFVADKAILMWKFLGRMFGYLSSFITYLKFEALLTTIHTLAWEMWRLCLSPLWGIFEYFKVVFEYKLPILIVIGSLLIIGAVGWGLYWIDVHYFGFVFNPRVTSQNKVK